MKAITKEFCEQELTRLYNEHGKVTKTILKDYGSISMAPINRLFGDLTSALESLSIPLSKGQARNYSKEEVTADILKVFKEQGYISKPLYEKEGNYNSKVVRRIFGSFGEMYEELKLPRHPSGYVPSDKELIDDLISLQSEHSIVTKDIITRFGKFCTTTYNERFGNLNESYKRAGLPTRNAGECSHANWVINRYAKFLNEEPSFEHRFDWLRNPNTDRILPIDGYFPESNIAIEYNGPQHYHVDNRYTVDEEALLYRQVLDEFKYHTIREHGVHLIVIDYRHSFTEEYIINTIKNIRE